MSNVSHIGLELPGAIALYHQAASINAALEVCVGLHTLQPSSTDADEIVTHRHLGGLMEIIRLAADDLTLKLCVLSDDENNHVLNGVPSSELTPEPALTLPLFEPNKEQAALIRKFWQDFDAAGKSTIQAEDAKVSSHV